jgi:hypothetical protein
MVQTAYRCHSYSNIKRDRSGMLLKQWASVDILTSHPLPLVEFINQSFEETQILKMDLIQCQ